MSDTTTTPAAGQADLAAGRRNPRAPSPGEARIEQAPPKSQPLQLPVIQDAFEFLTWEHKEPPQLVSGLLHQATKLGFSGPSKARKSWVLLDLGLSVAYGEPFMSIPTTQARVCYVNLELPEFSLDRRLRAIIKEKQIKNTAGQFFFWHLRGHAAGYQDLLPQMEDVLGLRGFGLIIIDPVYKFLGGANENNANEVAAMLNSFERLVKATGAAVVYAAHFSKGNQASKESIDRASGTGVFARDPDSVVSMTAHQIDGAFTIEPVLRNFPPMQPFVIRWDYPLMRREDDLDPSKLKQIGGRKQESDENDLLKVLPEEGLVNKDWIDQAKDKEGISERTFYRLRKSLAKSNRILESKVNGKWMPVKSKL